MRAIAARPRVPGDPHWVVIDTPRLVLRPAMRQDAAALSAALATCRDPESVLPCPPGDLGAWLQRAEAERRAGEGYTFLMIDRVGLDLAGAASLRFEDGAAEVGYWVAPAFRRQGVAGETLAALTDYVLRTLRLPYLDAMTEYDNWLSQHLLQRQGFILMAASGADRLKRWRRYP